MSQVTISEEDRARLFDALDELQRLAKTETDLVRVLVHRKCKKAVSGLLPSRKERLAYESSDGNRASRAVGDIAGVSHNTINRWWRTWVDKGMGEYVPAARGSGQSFKARYTLPELAVAVLEGEVTPD